MATLYTTRAPIDQGLDHGATSGNSRNGHHRGCDGLLRPLLLPIRVLGPNCAVHRQGMDQFLVRHPPLANLSARWQRAPSNSRCSPLRLLVSRTDGAALGLWRATDIDTVTEAQQQLELPVLRLWLVAPISHTPVIVPTGARTAVIERELSTSVTRPLIELGMEQASAHFRQHGVAFLTTYLSVDGRTLVSQVMARDPSQLATVNRAVDMAVRRTWEAECLEHPRAL